MNAEKFNPSDSKDEELRKDVKGYFGFIPEGLNNHFGIPTHTKGEALAKMALEKGWKSINPPSGLPNEEPWPVGTVDFSYDPSGFQVQVSCGGERDWLREVPEDVFPQVKNANDEIRRRLASGEIPEYGTPEYQLQRES